MCKWWTSFLETKNSTGKAVQLCDRLVSFLAKKGHIGLEETCVRAGHLPMGKIVAYIFSKFFCLGFEFLCLAQSGLPLAPTGKHAFSGQFGDKLPLDGL